MTYLQAKNIKNINYSLLFRMNIAILHVGLRLGYFHDEIGRFFCEAPGNHAHCLENFSTDIKFRLVQNKIFTMCVCVCESVCILN